MKIKFLLCALLTFFSLKIIAQSTDEEALKNVVHLENESFTKKDTSTWKSLYIQDKKMRRTFISNGGVYKIDGWNNYYTQVMQWLQQSSSPPKYTEVKDDNYVI